MFRYRNFILRRFGIFLSFFMIRWIPYAFLRIVLFFIAGITLGIYFPGILRPAVRWPLVFGTWFYLMAIIVVALLEKAILIHQSKITRRHYRAGRCIRIWIFTGAAQDRYSKARSY